MKENKGIRKDYVRLQKMDVQTFCKPRYIIRRELRIRNLKTEWDLKAWRYEKRCRGNEKNIVINACWEEKSKMDMYSKERECYLNEMGWRIEVVKELKEVA